MRKMMLFSVLITILIIITGCSSPEESDSSSATGTINKSKEYKLTINNFEAAGGTLDKFVYSEWIKLVEEKTNGQVKVDIQHGGALGSNFNVHQDIAAGVYDLSFIVGNLAYDSEYFPYSIITLPFAAESSVEAAELSQAFAEKVMDLESLPTKVGAAVTTDAYNLISEKPVDLKDLKGLKMRIITGADAEFVKAIDGVPIALPTAEVYEALQKGILDTSFSSPTLMQSYRFHEVAPYIKKINFSFTPLIPAMNKNFYNSLSNELKVVFDEELIPALSELAVNAYEQVAEDSYTFLEEQIKGKGEISIATDEEIEYLKSASKSAWDTWKEDADARGYDGEKLVDTFLDLLDELGVSRPF